MDLERLRWRLRTTDDPEVLGVGTVAALIAAGIYVKTDIFWPLAAVVALTLVAWVLVLLFGGKVK